MSAFVVQSEHIGALVKFYLTARPGSLECWRGNPVNHNDAGDMMACLMAENVRSVNARYQTHEPQEPEILSDRLSQYADINEVQALKACACLEYQSCETEDYRDTEAYHLLRQIEKKAIRQIDGYEDADWEIRYTAATQRERAKQQIAERAERVRIDAAYRRAYSD
jgi:hypothetical protein